MNKNFFRFINNKFSAISNRLSNEGRMMKQTGMSVQRSHFSLLIVSFFLLSFTSIIKGQSDSDEQYNFCKKLYSEESYFDAITEAKRLLIFDTTGRYAFRANMLIGKSYKQGGHLNESVEYFTKALIVHSTRQELYESKIELIKVNILRRRITLALKQLKEMEAESLFSEDQNEIDYWRAWAHVFNDDWVNGAYYFSISDTSGYLEKFCYDIENQKYSVTFAKAISYVLPGAGQIYTGEYLNGILSLGWNILSGYLTINSFISERVFDGAVSLSFFWGRFYVGNVMNAESFAIRKNTEIINKAMLYLQTNYEGKKP